MSGEEVPAVSKVRVEQEHAQVGLMAELVDQVLHQLARDDMPICWSLAVFAGAESFPEVRRLEVERLRGNLVFTIVQCRNAIRQCVDFDERGAAVRAFTLFDTKAYNSMKLRLVPHSALPHLAGVLPLCGQSIAMTSAKEIRQSLLAAVDEMLDVALSAGPPCQRADPSGGAGRPASARPVRVAGAR